MSDILNGSQSIEKNVRLFWSWKSRDQPIQYGKGNCGAPLPIHMDLVCKGSASKCLDSESKKSKKHVKDTVSKEKSLVDDLTWWEKIFGPSQKRFWPDPCTCRLMHKEEKSTGAQDPRLCDRRYKMTEGYVLLYTERMKQFKKVCWEPQPTPPPGYKVPKAAWIKMVNNMCDQPVFNDEGLSKSTECEMDEFLKPPKIPYEELRPIEQKRKSFVCYQEVPSENVLPPINRDQKFNQHFKKRLLQQSNLEVDPKKFQEEQNNMCEKEIVLKQLPIKHSRIEQLKALVKENDAARQITSTS